jgi:hypothetical protein
LYGPRLLSWKLYPSNNFEPGEEALLRAYVEQYNQYVDAENRARHFKEENERLVSEKSRLTEKLAATEPAPEEDDVPF